MGFSREWSFALLCWAISEVVSYNPWDFSGSHSVVQPSPRPGPPARWPLVLPSLSELNGWAFVDASQPRALSPLMPVTVQCGEAQMLVTVDRDLFGTGRLIQAADLSLGEAGCKHTSLDAVQDTVVFEVGLHECGSTLQMTPELLVYSLSLYYKPTPVDNPVILRSSPVEVPIDCYYARRKNVSSNAINPTWVPFSSTLSAEAKIRFSLRLMNDDWSAERSSNGYRLGDAMHIQADANTENHVALRLFIDSCMATLSPDSDSTPQYAIMDHKGCLIDGREDSSSAFLAPRLKDDSLRFTVDVFRFTGDPRDLIYITCHLKVAPADQAPNYAHKACSFDQATDRWIPVEGARDICSCCETGNCDFDGGQPRRLYPWDRWQGRRRLGRDVAPGHDQPVKEVQTDITVGPVFILDAYLASRHPASQPREAMETTAEDGFFPAPEWMALGLIVVAVAMILAWIVLGIFVWPKKHSGSPV